MKTHILVAALLMTGTAAHAGNSISFEINGHKVHIEAPKNCDQLSCVKISAPGLSAADFGFKSTKSFGGDDNDDVRNDPPAGKPIAPPVVQAAAPPASAAAITPPASTVVTATTPAPPVKADAAPLAPAAASSPVQASAPVAAAPAQAALTPLGVWATEENKGNVRIEPCGQGLCGYAVNTGEKVLINMKPAEATWVGRIHDPDSGNTYDSTIAMKGANTLRVQGCAFGGLFCGGQTWNRVS